MALWVVRSLQFLCTVVVAVPVAVLGGLTALEGRVVTGVVFVALAVGLVAGSEYVYTRLTDRTVGRLKRLKPVR